MATDIPVQADFVNAAKDDNNTSVQVTKTASIENRSKINIEKEPTAATIVSRYLPLDTEDVEEWWKDCGPLFGRFLQAAQYDPHEQYQHLLFLQKLLIPALGPHPQKWRSTITRSGLPIEYSINFQASVKPTLRIGFEPVSFLSGTHRDPFNQIAITDLMTNVTKLRLPGFDDTLFHHFINDFFLSSKEQQALMESGEVTQKTVRSQAAFGFDLKGTNVSVKGYVFCGMKHRATGQPVGKLITDAVTKIDHHTQCAHAFKMLNDYMEASSGYNQYTFLSWDCVDAPQSRLKFYGVHNEVTWRKIAEMWTLNGQLDNSDIIKGLALLKELWQLLQIPEGDSGYSGGFDDGITSGEKEIPSPMIWNFELKRGSRFPQPKFYFPIHGKNDLKVAEALAAFYRMIGWNDLAASYVQIVRDL